MKKVIIIGTYPSNTFSEEILISCIDSVSNKGYDIMVVSHYPLPTHIQEKVNYCIYDKENLKIPLSLNTHLFLHTDLFELTIRNKGHALAISKNIFTSINFANILNYDFFFYMESDNIFSEEDFTKLDNLYYKMIEENKKMIFFNSILFGDEYETLIFGGIPLFYVNNIKLPITLEEYKNINEIISFERLVYHLINSLSNNFLIIKEESQHFFKNSKINQITHDYFADIVVDNNDNIVLFLFNRSNKEIPTNFIINKNEPITLNSGCWYYCFKNIGDEIEIKINDGDSCITHKHFVLTEDSKAYYKHKNSLMFR